MSLADCAGHKHVQRLRREPEDPRQTARYSERVEQRSLRIRPRSGEAGTSYLVPGATTGIGLWREGDAASRVAPDEAEQLIPSVVAHFHPVTGAKKPVWRTRVNDSTVSDPGSF